MIWILRLRSFALVFDTCCTTVLLLKILLNYYRIILTCNMAEEDMLTLLKHLISLPFFVVHIASAIVFCVTSCFSHFYSARYILYVDSLWSEFTVIIPVISWDTVCYILDPNTITSLLKTPHIELTLNSHTISHRFAISHYIEKDTSLLYLFLIKTASTSTLIKTGFGVS